MNFFRSSLFFFLILNLGLSGCSRGPSNPSDPDYIVAEGKSFHITRSELNREISRTKTGDSKSPAPPLSMAAEKNVLNRLIEFQLLERHLDAFKIKNLDSAAAQEYQKSRDRFRTPTEFEAYLQVSGLDEAGFREQIRRFVLLKLVRQALETQSPPVLKEEEIQTEYQKNPGAWQRPEVLQVNRVIFRSASGDKTDRLVALRKAAHQFREKLVAGVPFAKAASALKPGDFPLGLTIGPDSWTASSLPTGLAASALKLSPGATGALAEIPEGIVVYQVSAKIPARTIPLAEAEKQIRSRLEAQVRSRQWQSTLESLKKEAAVQVYLK